MRTRKDKDGKDYDRLQTTVIVIEMFHIDCLSYWNSSASPRSVQRSPVLPCALLNTVYSVDPPSCVCVLVHELFAPENITTTNLKLEMKNARR